MTSSQHLDNIIITRPKPWCDDLAKQLKNLNFKTSCLPSIDIKPLALPNINTPFDIVIFISPTAALLGHTLARLGNNIGAIGQGTCAALLEQGIKTDIAPSSAPFHSEALLAQAALQQLSGKTILLISGKGGRDLLQTTLVARGAIVTKAEIYERQLPTLSTADINAAFEKNQNNLIISTSIESLNHFCTLIKKAQNHVIDLYQLQLLVISPKMADWAKSLGFQKPAIVAKSARDEDIIAALKFKRGADPHK